jgi:hypothetical protein
VVISLGNGALAARRTGDWSWVFNELAPALADEAEGADRLFLLEAAVGLRALRGEDVRTELDEMAVLVGASTDPGLVGSLQLARADDAFAQARLKDARDAWHKDADLTAEYLPTMLARAARAALWLGDGAGAADDLAALDAAGVHGPAIEADRLTIRASLAALAGSSADALALYRDALRAWRDLGLAWDQALCAIDMATLVDPAEPEVRAAADAAREILVRLGAVPFVRRLDAAMERSPGSTPAAAEVAHPGAARSGTHS